MTTPKLDLLAEARRLDADRTLALAFAEPADRPLLAALVLFNAELARIPEIVNEPMAGMIRYQWWRDAVARAAAGQDATQHPLLPPLAQGLADGRLRQAELEALIDVREAELDRLQPSDLDALEAYALATSGRLHRLMAEALAADQPQREAAAQVGTGFALVGILRAIAFHRAQGRTLLPADLLEAAAIDRQTILEQQNAEALARVSRAVIERANAHLAEARRAGPFPRRLMPALLPARLAKRQAGRLLAGASPTEEVGRGAGTVPDLLWGWLRRRL